MHKTKKTIVINLKASKVLREKKRKKASKIENYKINTALQSTKGRKTSQDGLLPPIKIIVSY